ncbi:MAG TPA: hypothetical protein VFS80_11475 [Burkholderiales bacterium]|nr:hypothetical protein [Burkholderiales bacterium]
MQLLSARVCAAIAFLAGLACPFAATAQSDGYTCCNFHYDGDWISDANWSSLPKIPAGTPVRIVEYGDNRVSVDIGGRRMFLGLDYGRKLGLRAWTQMMVVADDPKKRIAAWPAAVRETIESGQVAVGMTKEQVIVSLGYPPAHATPSTDAPQWKYWHTTHGTYQVVWDANGRVKDLAADPPIRFALLSEQELGPTGGAGPVQLKDLAGLLPGIAIGGRTAAASAAARPGTPASSLPAPGLPGAGTRWVYAFSDRHFGKQLGEVTVSVLRVEGATVEEAVSSGSRDARRAVDTRETRFYEHVMRGETLLVEFAPYLVAAREGKAPDFIGGGSGYPIGPTGFPGWRVSSQVQGWESVSVPAGSYKALRVEVSGQRERDAFTNSSHTGRFRMSLWYAPDVMRVVRIEHQTYSGALSQRGQPVGNDLVELVKFAQGGS